MRKYLGQAGVTIIEALVILTALGAMVAVTTGVVLKIKQTQVRNSFLNQVVFLRDSYMASLYDNRVWKTTVETGDSNLKNNRLTCLRTKTNCTVNPEEFTPYDGDGRPLFNYDPVANPKAGFTRTGLPCLEFDPANPSEECPVRFEFVLTPKSATTNPEVDIKIEIEFAVPETSSLAPNPNPENYEANPLSRPGTPNYLSSQQCPPKQIVVGFNPDGTIRCQDSSVLATSSGGANTSCVCPKTGCRCSKMNVCSCPGRCGKSCP